jgi:hyperosmotically inducible protein
MKINHRIKLLSGLMWMTSVLVACDNQNSAQAAKNNQMKENISNVGLSGRDNEDQAVITKITTTGQPLDDGSITAKVKQVLLNESSLQFSKITLFTEKGVVTLSGSVDSQTKIDKAVDLSASVEGVRSVKSKLVITR